MNGNPTGDTTKEIQRIIGELKEEKTRGAALAELFNRAADRLRKLAMKILYKSFPRLAQPPMQVEPLELVNGAVVRLLKAMKNIRPGTHAEFLALASMHIRWQLLDLIKELEEKFERLDNPDQYALTNNTPTTPPTIWYRLIAEIQQLEETDCELVDLLFTQGMTIKEAADLRQCSEKTIQRDRNRILLTLADKLGEDPPHLLE